MRRLFPLATLTGLIVAVTVPRTPISAADDYTYGPDSAPQSNVPKGAVTQFRWKTSKVFEGTERDCWVYVPSQYDGRAPACVMVFQDGGSYVGEKGQFRAPIV